MTYLPPIGVGGGGVVVAIASTAIGVIRSGLHRTVLVRHLYFSQAGTLGSAFQITSGAAKILTPVFVDTHSPRLVLSGALLLCALANFIMCLFTDNLLVMTSLPHPHFATP